MIIIMSMRKKYYIHLFRITYRYTYLVAKKKTTFHHPPAGTLRPHGPPWLTPAAMHGTSSGISVTPRHTKPRCFSVWMHACMYVQYCYHYYPYHIHMLYYACTYIYISVCVCMCISIYLMCPQYSSHAYSDWDRLLCSKERTILRISSGAAVVTGRSAQ